MNVYSNQKTKLLNKKKNPITTKNFMVMGFLLADVNGLEPLTLRTSSVICTPLQLLKQRIYAEKEQYRIAKNKTVAHELHTRSLRCKSKH